MIDYDTWKLGIDDPYFDKAEEEENDDLLAPVYIIGGQAKETATGRDLTNDECEDMSEKFCDKYPLEVWMRAEKRVDFLVKIGKLK